MLHAGSCQLLQVLISEVIVQCGADIFVSYVDTANSLIVRRQRNRDMGRAVNGEWVVAALDSQYPLVGAEIDFDHHVLPGQLREQGRAIVLVHDVYPVTDALGVSPLERLADVEAKPL